MTCRDWKYYLIGALKEELNSREEEIGMLRMSLRYRLGGWVLEAWPPGYRTLVIMARMLMVFIRLKKRNGNTRGATTTSIAGAIPEARLADTLVFGTEVPWPYKGERTICSNDPAILMALLDSDRPAGTLVITVADQVVTRRIQRLRLNGWWVVWWPEVAGKADESPQGCYLLANADECQSGVPS